MSSTAGPAPQAAPQGRGAYEVRPLAGPIRAAVRPPGSKSLTNRALVCAALAHGHSRLSGALDSEDTRVMVAALASLGVELVPDWPAARVTIAGCDGRIPAKSAELYVANSGTTARFLTAVAAAGHGRFRLDGTPRMRERPIADLLDALGQLGVAARSENNNGCPPVVIDAAGLPGGTVRIRGDVSSQFASGLLLAAPAASAALEIVLDGPLVSQPYVRATLAVMAAFGVQVEATADLSRLSVAAGQQYVGREYPIEPDASAASYFWAAAAVTGSRITVLGLHRDSLQGDVAFCDVLAQMGCTVEADPRGLTVVGGRLHGIDVDMNAISDTVQSLAAVALFADGPTTIRGVAHIRHKETDRLAALACELRKLGATVDERADGLRIVPGTPRPATIETYDDHRMAMSLAVVGLARPGVTIVDPGCTAKTYPRFFADLAALATGGAETSP